MTLPVGHARFIQGHKIDLTRGATLGAAEKHFIVTFAQELEPLGLLVHKHAIQMSRFYRSYFDGLVAPAHYLSGSNIRHRRWHLTPLHKQN